LTVPELPPLADPILLADYPGGPFSARTIASASASVRNDCRWHVAPVVTETVTVDGCLSRLLLLPTLRLVNVTGVEVLDDSSTTWLPITGWRIANAGMLYRATGWNYGPAGIRVTMQHGFAETPADLLPVLAARCQRNLADSILTQRSETVGTRTSSESYNVNRLQIEAGASALTAYRLPPRAA
jgi:hypothetical protein